MPPPPKRPTSAAHQVRRRHRQANHESAHADAESNHTEVPELTGVCRGRPTLVTEDAQLAAVLAELKSAGTFAFDTEFIGEASYRPQLCLIQIATTTNIWLIDPLAGVDPTPLLALAGDSAVRTIVHAGDQDMDHIVRAANATPANVFDTQVAAGLVGLGYPVSLAKLVQEITGVRMHKGFTFTDWTARPLSGSQLRYAADDVRYLPAIAAELDRRLAAFGRTEWAADECEERCAKTRANFDPATAWQRVRGSASLDARGVGILRELVAWRKAAAEQADLPARAFLKDEVLIDLSRRPAKTLDKLRSVKHMPRPLVESHGQIILDAITRGLNRKYDGPLPELPPEPTLAEKARADAVWAAVQTRCHSLGIDPTLAMTRQDVADFDAALSSGKSLAGLRLHHGWRSTAVGDWLQKFLAGTVPIHATMTRDRLVANEE